MKDDKRKYLIFIQNMYKLKHSDSPYFFNSNLFIFINFSLSI